MTITLGINTKKTKQGGYASVTLMVFVIIGITITTAATVIMSINSLAASRMQQGLKAYDVAEGGVENGIVGLLRDPVNYSGETVHMFDGSSGKADVSVSADKTTVTSVGTVGHYVRKIQAQVSYTDNLVVTSWKEVY